jgi:hypothetical protein
MSKVTLRFFKSQNLGKVGSLESIFQSLISLHFSDITNIMVGKPISEGLYAWWKDYDNTVLDEIGIAYEKGMLKFIVLDDQSDEYKYLSFLLDSQWEYDNDGYPIKQEIHAYSTNSALFSAASFDREFYAQRLLSVGIEMYKILEPEFGWIERLGQRGYTSKKDVSALSIPHIYWANFFGPEYVEKYGLEFFQNAPGWRKEVIDQGFLYVLSPHMGTKRRDTIGEEVKSYFRIDSVRMEKRK